MAKRRRVVVAPTPVRESHKRDPIRDRRERRLVGGAIGAVLLVAFGIGAFGYYDTYFQPPRRTALSVGERSFSASDLKTRLKLDIADNGGFDAQQPTLPDAQKILDQMQDEEVVRQSAVGLGLNTNQDEVNESIAERIGSTFGGPGSPFDTAYREELTRSGLDGGEYHELIEADVLEKKIQAVFGTALPETSDQVKLEMILVDSEEEAKTVIGRITGKEVKGPPGGRGEADSPPVVHIEGAEGFATVAQSASRDTETASTGGALDWTPYGVLAPDLEKVVFTLERNKLSDPIETGRGWWVVRVTDRGLGTFIAAAKRDDLVQKAYGRWVKSRATALNAQQFLDDEMRTWALREALN